MVAPTVTAPWDFISAAGRLPCTAFRRADISGELIESGVSSTGTGCTSVPCAKTGR